MKVRRILEMNGYQHHVPLFQGDEWKKTFETLATEKGPKHVADMWSHHKRVHEIVDHLKQNLGELGPNSRKAAKILFDMFDTENEI